MDEEDKLAYTSAACGMWQCHSCFDNLRIIPYNLWVITYKERIKTLSKQFRIESSALTYTIGSQFFISCDTASSLRCGECTSQRVQMRFGICCKRHFKAMIVEAVQHRCANTIHPLSHLAKTDGLEASVIQSPLIAVARLRAEKHSFFHTVFQFGIHANIII